MSDSPKTFLESINERFNSTLVISFFFYVILLNWKAFVYLINTDLIPEQFLVTEDGVISRLDFIQSQFSTCRTFWYPLLLAGASVLILPVLNWAVSWWRKYIRIKRENANRKQEYGDLSKTTADWQKVYDEKKELAKDFEEAIGNYRQANKENEELKVALNKQREAVGVKEMEIVELKKVEAELENLRQQFLKLAPFVNDLISHPDLKHFESQMPSIHRNVIKIAADIKSIQNLMPPNYRLVV